MLRAMDDRDRGTAAAASRSTAAPHNSTWCGAIVVTLSDRSDGELGLATGHHTDGVVTAVEAGDAVLPDDEHRVPAEAACAPRLRQPSNLARGPRCQYHTS